MLITCVILCLGYCINLLTCLLSDLHCLPLARYYAYATVFNLLTCLRPDFILILNLPFITTIFCLSTWPEYTTYFSVHVCFHVLATWLHFAYSLGYFLTTPRPPCLDIIVVQWKRTRPVHGRSTFFYGAIGPVVIPSLLASLDWLLRSLFSSWATFRFFYFVNHLIKSYFCTF